jgi:hypothetical protein
VENELIIWFLRLFAGFISLACYRNGFSFRLSGRTDSPGLPSPLPRVFAFISARSDTDRPSHPVALFVVHYELNNGYNSYDFPETDNRTDHHPPHPRSGRDIHLRPGLFPG